MRRAVSATVAVLVIVGVPAIAWISRSNASTDDSVRTIELGIRFSRFSTSAVTVKAGSTVRFVVHNDDPILHELIVGPPEVHRRHEDGTEPRHPPRPGEITIDPKTSATTEYTFDTVGSIEFACHLPGHRAYGMTGEVRVVP